METLRKIIGIVAMMWFTILTVIFISCCLGAENASEACLYASGSCLTTYMVKFWYDICWK